MYKNTDFKIGSSVGTAYKQFVIAVSRMAGAGGRREDLIAGAGAVVGGREGEGKGEEES